MARPGSESAVDTPRSLGASGRIVVTLLVGAGAVVAASSGPSFFIFVPYAGVAALLVIRRPQTSIGWILMALSWGFTTLGLAIDATPQQFAFGSVSAPNALFAIAEGAGGGASFYLFGVLAMVFPSGRLPSGKWGVASRAALGGCLLLIVATLAMPVISVTLVGYPATVLVTNPFAIFPNLQIWTLIRPDTVIFPIMIVTAAATISLVVRFHRARGIERQQLRWISASGAFVILGVGTGFVVGTLIPGSSESGLAWIGAIIAFPCVPLAIGIAVLRYRLYEIDRIISRTIGWVILTGVLATVFAIVIVGLQTVLAGVTGNNSLAVAASTLIVAALFAPLRSRVQRGVDRRFRRARYDADRTAEAFAEDLRQVVDPEKLRAELRTVINRTLEPSSAQVWVRDTGARASR